MRRSKREVAAAVERIEAVACANLGDEERELMLRPNDLRRVVDHFDDILDSHAALRAEVKRLKRCVSAARGITAPVLRHICEDAHPEEDFDPECAWCQIQGHLTTALKPRRAKGKR